MTATTPDRYAASDADTVRAGLRLLEAGLPLPDLLALGRRQHAMTRAIAEEAVAMFDANVRQPLLDTPLSDEERASRLVESFRTLLPTVTTLVAAHFRSVLLEVARGAPRVASGTISSSRRLPRSRAGN